MWNIIVASYWIGSTLVDGKINLQLVTREFTFRPGKHMLRRVAGVRGDNIFLF
jgi:hypothetical protein